MISAKNYQKFSKFVKVTAKILSVPFLRDTVHGATTTAGRRSRQAYDMCHIHMIYVGVL